MGTEGDDGERGGKIIFVWRGERGRREKGRHILPPQTDARSLGYKGHAAIRDTFSDYLKI